MRRIGINMNACNGLTDEEYVSLIAELGFTATFSKLLEEDRQAELAELLAARGVEYQSIHAPFSSINEIWKDSLAGEEVLDRFIKSADRCAELGIPIVVAHLSSGDGAPPVTDIGRARFDRFIDHAVSKNVRVAFENQRKLSNIAWAFESYTADDGVGFCWDCGHEACFAGGREYMPLFGSRLICTHIHDNFAVKDGDLHLLPFDGAIDFGRVAAQIASSGYDGPLMLEVAVKRNEQYLSLSCEEYLQRAAAAANRLVEMI